MHTRSCDLKKMSPESPIFLIATCVLPSTVFRIWALTQRHSEQGALQIQFLETFQFKSFARLEILWAQKFKRDNILQLTEKTENFLSLCTNFKDTENTHTDKDIQIQGDFLKCILVILIPTWTVSSVYRLLNQLKRLNQESINKMQNVLSYNLMADLPPDRLNHLGLGLNWLHSKTTMVRTKKNDSSFVFEWT